MNLPLLVASSILACVLAAASPECKHADAHGGNALLQTRFISRQTIMLQDKRGEYAEGLTRNTSLIGDLDEGVLYYHVHLPKTGGTTTSNIIVSNLCGLGNGGVQSYGWRERCKVPCARAMVDTEVACMSGSRWEHPKMNHISDIVVKVKKSFPIRHVVYITTLRKGSKRLVSQWAHEMNELKTWEPPPHVPRMSNESLLLYLAGANWTNKWVGVEADSVSQRNNFQVASLAAVPGNVEVTAEHLEQAKHTLKTGKWVIGFTECLPQLHHRLWTLGSVRSESTFNGTLPRLQHRAPSDLHFNDKVKDELERQTQFDNELYQWAWRQSITDSRFVSCELHS